MDNAEKLKKAIQSLARQDIQFTVAATVISVDLTKGTCKVKPVDDGEIHNVRLQAVTGQTAKGMLLIPKLNSFVLVSSVHNSNTDYFVSMFSELEEIKINNGKNGGLIKIKELKADLEKVNKILNALLNALQTATPMPGDGGAAIQAAVKLAVTGLQTPDYSKIENEFIKH